VEAVTPAIFTFAAAGTETAQRIAALTGGTVHEGKSLLPVCFTEGRPIIGVCSAGILIRLLAPLLSDKHAEPPVIAVSQDGAEVVPLLGGHHGANSLARKIAEALGGRAALTTASDSRFAFGLDEPPEGFVLANPERAKSVMAMVLAGEAISATGDTGWLVMAGYHLSPNGRVRVVIGEVVTEDSEALCYHPKTLVAGVGCERGADAAEIIGLIETSVAAERLSPLSLAAIGTIDLKADETGLLAAAEHFRVPLRLFTAAELDAERARLANPSAIVEAEIGVAGVAEAVALKAGKLLVEKIKSKRATCAIGIALEPVDLTTFGRPPGHLHIVGIGPGEAVSRTASAVAALSACSDWVGYGLYLDLIGDLRFGQREHRFPLGEEEARVRHALELAAQGKDVALVCSGDGQIYAMASLVYELLGAEGSRALSDPAKRVLISSHSGLSALQVASARAGALLGHDFCAISLSDLLTPREDILRRIEAAAIGDFVVALYNPRSQRRTDLIERAKAILLAHRPIDTPVVIGSNLGRPQEVVTVTTLAEFDPETIDMLSIVLIGSSTSRAFKRGDGRTVAYTPRGYARKAEVAE
jgi:cobalt-precorrin 5A hydrolase/precorrin-3B C17-methyltransferase